jgi:predicted nucleotidyltransferase component of viral defense system
MLYRLSMSQYRDNFCLKGSALLFAYEKFKARPTKDIDFLGDKISRDKETIRKAFREICSIQCPEDGLAFDNGENDIKVEDISLDKEYNGVTVTVTAHLDTIVQPFSMDIGFGDIVVPEPQELDYPLLLDDMPEVSINAYSLETVVAEKFQTMIDRALANSRMKDFYDVYSILSSDKMDKGILSDAIVSVFNNRGTGYDDNHPLFNGEFKNDPIKQTQWNAFLRKMKYKGDLPLNEVVDYITEKLSPYWLSLNK